jgi:hypothetical protein
MPCPVEEIIIKSKCGSQLILVTSIFGDRSGFKKCSMIGIKIVINLYKLITFSSGTLIIYFSNINKIFFL